MNNTRFATSLHILLLLARNPHQWLSSDWLAISININPVVVRRELSQMHERGWLSSRKGKEGGTRLAVSSREITVKDVYLLTQNAEILGRKNLNPNPDCPVGKKVNSVLEKLNRQAETAVLDILGKRTLEGLLSEFE